MPLQIIEVTGPGDVHAGLEVLVTVDLGAGAFPGGADVPAVEEAAVAAGMVVISEQPAPRWAGGRGLAASGPLTVAVAGCPTLRGSK